MVVGPKKVIQQVPSRISLMKIQNFTAHKRQSFVTVVYGTLFIIAGIISFAINPAEIYTNWFVDIKEGKFVYKMWKEPTYEIFSDIYIFNYTNVPEFLSGKDKQLRVDEIGPYKFQEIRTNENISIDKDRGVMTMNPVIKLKFLPDKSVGQYSDPIIAPNIALVAISTLLADQMGYFANAAAYYSITALGSKLFLNMNAGEFFWGYNDPLVKVASTLLPGWIDFGKVGILDRFYAQRRDKVEVELGNRNKRYSINTWNDSPGLPEQGYTTLNESILCNRLKGTYEGLMITPRYNVSNPLPIFRKQACRVYPFRFLEERMSDMGFPISRFKMDESAFNKSSPFACTCTKNCLPDGFVDIGSCYYGFPIALSKPHFLDADPEQQKMFVGMHPDPEAHASHVDIETSIGVPLSLRTNMQVNIAVRASGGNPSIRPVKDKVLPLMWLSLKK
ncbi:unnamed protein product [Leptidea sinapis]|uniref:Scavenger receptor class B member 1 n=1 Tax=Leptidea sinapis TaxID=189913 RepID=A0A5E4R6P8_9NEOP|nr:unnamed protein product [Leptidea sinapis]